jgi:glutamate/tyrosine decarboxylase-like PLP-dependent enzyme
MVLNEIQDVVETVQSGIASGPIVPNVTPEEIRDYLTSRYYFKSTVPLDDVIADVEQMLQTWQVQVTHPRYFGLFNPSVTLASVVADTLVAMYNPQLASWRTSPAANEIERHTLAWLAA